MSIDGSSFMTFADSSWSFAFCEEAGKRVRGGSGSFHGSHSSSKKDRGASQ